MKIVLNSQASAIYVRSCYKNASPRAYGLHNETFYNLLKKVDGQTLEVETNFLFIDQFNTAPIPGVSELGLRVMGNVVDKVIDDVRFGNIINRYTGKQFGKVVIDENWEQWKKDNIPEDQMSYLTQMVPHPNKIVREAGVFLWEVYMNDLAAVKKYWNSYMS